jgi:hypothetical protein
MKRGNVPTQNMSGKSAVFLMESALTQLQQVEQKAVRREMNLGLVCHICLKSYTN